MVLTEFDPTKEAIINPEDVVSKIDGFPKVAVSCFGKDLIDEYIKRYGAKEIAKITNANGSFPVYEIEYKETKLALYMSPVGAPMSVGFYENVLVFGAEKLILFGTCGVLDKNINDCSIIIPTSAIRDEGTSYHYAEASDEILVNEKYIDIFEDILDKKDCSHTKGKVWTTDALFRETRSKIDKRKDSGCICVDMECSAMSAVSKFRNKDFFQFFYAADNLDSDKWDKRSLSNKSKLDEKFEILLLALDLAVEINDL